MKILTDDEVCKKFGWFDYEHFLLNEDNMETRLFNIMSYVLELHRERLKRAENTVKVFDTMLIDKRVK